MAARAGMRAPPGFAEAAGLSAGLPRDEFSLGKSFDDMTDAERLNFYRFKFVMNNYYEYHRRGRTLNHGFMDPDAPWQRALRDPSSHWALYSWHDATHTVDPELDWHRIFLERPVPLDYPPWMAETISWLPPRRINYRAYDPLVEQANAPTYLAPAIQRLLSAEGVPLTIRTVFNEGGQVSLG